MFFEQLQVFQSKRLIFTIFFVAFFFSIQPAKAGYFHQADEFPNYFLPPKYRALAPMEIPPSVVQESRALIESALQSLNERLMVPLVLTGEPKARLVRYFPYLRDNLKQIDPQLRILPSGGVIRSELTYLYELLRSADRAHPHKEWSTTLIEVADSTEDVLASTIRGVGGDFDVLLDTRPENFQKISNELLRVTNSAEIKYGLSNSQSSMKRVFFTIGDCKDYQEQMDRATKQGGSTIDFLAFDVERGKFVEPEKFPLIVDRFIRGILDYVPPFSHAVVEDEAKQTIRGIRSRMELPWLLTLDETQIRSELERLSQQIKQGRIPSPKALDQFHKMVRNARYSGANNRFYRAAPGSVDALVLEIVSDLKRQTRINYLPEFIGSHFISHRQGNFKELNGLPSELLMSRAEFLKDYTKDGVVFHGTPHVQNALAIMRQGLFASKEGQGSSAYGRGSYLSPSFEVAEQFSGTHGLIFRMKLKPDLNIHILPWTRHVQSHPFIRALIEKTTRTGTDVFELLSRDYGIDIIINRHVLLQNSDVIEFPAGHLQLLQGLVYQIENVANTLENRLHAFIEFISLSRFSQDIGENSPDLKSGTTQDLLTQGFWAKSSFTRNTAFHALNLLPSGIDKLVLMTVSAHNLFFDIDRRLQANATSLFRSLTSKYIDDIENFAVLSTTEQSAIMSALFTLATNEPLSSSGGIVEAFLRYERIYSIASDSLKRNLSRPEEVRKKIQAIFDGRISHENARIRGDAIDSFYRISSDSETIALILDHQLLYDPDRHANQVVRETIKSIAQKHSSRGSHDMQALVSDFERLINNPGLPQDLKPIVKAARDRLHCEGQILGLIAL